MKSSKVPNTTRRRILWKKRQRNNLFRDQQVRRGLADQDTSGLQE